MFCKKAGRVCSALCVVLVLVDVRFGLWTMMAELCFSADDFFFFFLAILAIQQRTLQANTTAAGTVAAGQQRLCATHVYSSVHACS